ncbi:hypothetical protein [Synechococcus sp. MIT S1220]|uniref:hypothetical protein n=1 Tax=Synechococcus sp. MIT S1220 TaxID=3082549 RepID=UPI0039AF3330
MFSLLKRISLILVACLMHLTKQDVSTRQDQIIKVVHKTKTFKKEVKPPRKEQLPSSIRLKKETSFPESLSTLDDGTKNIQPAINARHQ